MNTATTKTITANSDLFDRQIPAFDGIRGLAILMVIQHHALGIAPTGPSWLGGLCRIIGEFGWTGVDFFFVLSGFLITGILMRTRGRDGWIKNFYARRILRIIPLYYATVAMLFLVLPLVPLSRLDWLRELAPSQGWYWLHVSNFRYMAGLSHPEMPGVGWTTTFWSLAIEEQFYLVWPAIVLLCKPRLLARFAIVGVLFSTLLRVKWAMAGVDSRVIYYHSLARLDGLLLGAAMSSWLFNGGSLDRLKRVMRPLTFVAAAGFIVPLFMGLSMSGRSQNFFGDTFIYTCSILLGAGLLVSALRPARDTWVQRRLRSRVLRTAGKYSYAMYMFNKPIIVLVTRSGEWLHIPPGLAFEIAGSLVASLLALGAAWLSWNLLEKHCLSLKRLFD